ncbi:hypothetical protein M0804_004678 [Polistes exclamans]|nr:hypothetical protein M0804_004678 [Polistes exclamans]
MPPEERQSSTEAKLLLKQQEIFVFLTEENGMFHQKFKDL